MFISYEKRRLINLDRVTGLAIKKNEHHTIEVMGDYDLVFDTEADAQAAFDKIEEGILNGSEYVEINKSGN